MSSIQLKTVNTSAEQVENILITTAKRCLKIRTTRRRKRTYSRSNKKWFDKECRLKRHELRKLSNEKHRDPLNTTLREKYHIVLQQYKKLLAHKRNEYYNNKLSELEDITYNLACAQTKLNSNQSLVIVCTQATYNLDTKKI